MDLDRVQLLGYYTQCDYPNLIHKSFFNFHFLTFIHFIYLIVEIESCFFLTLNLSHWESNLNPEFLMTTMICALGLTNILFLCQFILPS